MTTESNTPDPYYCRFCGLEVPPVRMLQAMHYWQAHYDEPAHQEFVRDHYGMAPTTE